MSIIYILIPIAALLTALGLYLFFWAVKTEQFDDLEKQGFSILFDEEEKTVNSNDPIKKDPVDNSHQSTSDNPLNTSKPSSNHSIKDN